MGQFYLDIAPMAPVGGMFDTQDLSTIRGSSAALLWAPDRVEEWLAARVTRGGMVLQTIFTGASEGLFLINAEVSPDRLVADLLAWLRADSLYRHFVFAVVTCENRGGFPRIRASLDSQRRFLRYQELAFALPEEASPRERGFCSVDRVRPAGDDVLPKHRNETHDRSPRVSPSVLARHEEGRNRRQDYYRKIAEDGGDTEDASAVREILKDRAFSDDFSDIVSDPPAEVSRVLANKLAVIQMDGNSFGKIRETLIGQLDTVDGLAFYSSEIKSKRAKLLRRLLEWAERSTFASGTERPDGYMTLEKEDRSGQGLPPRRFRFETLLWGGDEMLWVLPAWAAFDFLGEVQDEVKDWSVDDFPLTHSSGVVLCSYKTPIRQVKKLADELGQGANVFNETRVLYEKRNTLQIQVLESVDIPDGYLRRYRWKLFGIDGEDAFVQRPFTLPGGVDWPDVIGRLRRLDGRLPRSQVYRLLREARSAGALKEQGTGAAAAVFENTVALLAKHGLGEDELFHPALGYDTGGAGEAAFAHRLMPLVHLVTLWDYVDPLGEAVEAGDD